MIDDNSIIAAIDIGTTKIVALAGKKNDAGKFEILGLRLLLKKLVAQPDYV